MSDNIHLDEQQTCVDERATLTERHDEMKYYIFSSVSTDDDREQQQLQLYIYGQDSEGFVTNEIRRLGLVKVEKGNFSWNHPRGDIVTAIVRTGEFSCTKKLETHKLTSTRYPDKLTFTLPSMSNATQIIGNVEILDHDDRQLVILKNVKFPICPRETKHGTEHDENSCLGNRGQTQTV